MIELAAQKESSVLGIEAHGMARQIDGEIWREARNVLTAPNAKARFISSSIHRDRRTGSTPRRMPQTTDGMMLLRSHVAEESYKNNEWNGNSMAMR